MSGLQGFEAGIQAPLPLVEQAEEQNDGGPQFVTEDGRLGQGTCNPGVGQLRTTGQQLLASAPRIRSAIQPSARQLVAGQSRRSNKLA